MCALGSVAVARGLDLSDIDPEDPDARVPVARRLSITESLAAEIMWENDEGSDDLDGIVRSWTPEMVLPRLDRDRDIPLIA